MEAPGVSGDGKGGESRSAGKQASALLSPTSYFVTTNLPFIKVEWPGKLQKKL